VRSGSDQQPGDWPRGLATPTPTVGRSRTELYGPTKGALSGVPVGRSV